MSRTTPAIDRAELPGVARRLLHEVRLDILAEQLVRDACHLTGAARATLLLLEHGALELAAVCPPYEGMSHPLAAPLEVDDARWRVAEFALEAGRPFEIDRLTALPLLIEQHPEGVIVLEGAALSTDPMLRELFVGIAVVAIERSRRYAQLESEAVERARQLSQSIEQLHLTQNQLVQSEKLAALGGVVAGVTHEMSTPIGNALVVATSLKQRTEAFAEALVSGNLRRSQLEEFISTVAEASDLIEVNLRNAGGLLSQFRDVAADQISERRRRFELGEMLGEVIWTYQPQYRNTSHRIALSIEAGIWMESYPGPLGQIVGNLIKNAFQHGFDGVPTGVISITARRVDAEWVRIDVHDNGVGIPEQHLRRVFEPFFTTRLGSGGTGLGLSISYSIATRVLGGTIVVESSPGAGTTFTIDLPLVAPDQRLDT